MFKPRFRYTNKIVRLLTKISAAREVEVNDKLVKLGIVKAEGKGRGLYYDLA